MKTKLLFLSALFMAFSMNAQFTVEDGDGAAIEDGASYEYATLDFPDAELKFFINNPSTTDPINMRVEFVSVTGNTGDEMEICIGNCYNGTTAGTSYPTPGDGLFVTIDPEGQSLDGNHFLNTDPGNGTDPVFYEFRIYQVENDGTETGDEVNLSYTYDPTLGTSDLDALEVSVFPTITSDIINVRLVEDATVNVYDLRGRLVMNRALEAGDNAMNLSPLGSQTYLLQFTTKRGAVKTTKVVVK